MTFEDFERLPDTPEKLELLEGELIRRPVPTRKQMEIAHGLHKTLTGALPHRRQAGLCEAYIAMGYWMRPASWLRPDVSISRADQPRGKYLENAPALAVEIISEWSAAAEMDAKLRVYMAHGARQVWLVYPKTRRIWIHEAGSPSAIVRQGSFSSSLLPGMTLDLDRILG